MQNTVVTHPDGTTITTTTGGTPAESLVDCSRVFVKNDQYGGAGAFAAVPIKKGELVEKGIVRVLTNCDGNENPYVFTWSDEQPNTTWAIGSGCSTFYNTCDEATGNTHMEVRWLPLPRAVAPPATISPADAARSAAARLRRQQLRDPRDQGHRGGRRAAPRLQVQEVAHLLPGAQRRLKAEA